MHNKGKLNIGEEQLKKQNKKQKPKKKKETKREDPKTNKISFS